MDNLKKKKLDAKRISLTQKHEVQYLKKKVRELIKLCEADQKYSKSHKIRSVAQFYSEKGWIVNKMSTSTVRRIAKALLKAL